MAMKYKDVLGMRKQALFPKPMLNFIDKVLHYDLLHPLKKYNPATFKRYIGVNRARAARMAALRNSSTNQLLTDLTKANNTINDMGAQLNDATKAAGKWRNRALLGGGLAIAGTAGGVGLGRMLDVQQASGTVPSYEEWRKQQG